MADEQELTPEEKLLEVIQKGDGPATGSTADASGATIGDSNDAKPIAKSGTGAASPVSLKSINKILALAVLMAIGFSGYEIYKNLPQPRVVYDPSDLHLSVVSQAGLGASLSDTLNMFDKLRITGIPPDPYKPPPGGKDFEKLKGWRAYVRDNLKILALSKVKKPGAKDGSETVIEAIVMDTKLKKMHFLQVGQKIKITEKDVSVDKISEKTVELVCDDESQIIGDTAKK